jgi:hypothetical protein
MMHLDLHIHSKYSFDSLMDSKSIIKASIQENLGGIAVTDHNTILGGKKASQENESPLLIIVGAEIRTEVGDIIGLFLNEEIKSRNSLEMLDEVKFQGGVSVFPHPFKGHPANEKTRELFRKVDCIELLNSRAPITAKQRQTLFAFRKSFVAGSDAHFQTEIGLCQTVIESETVDLDVIRKSILSKNKTLFCRRYTPRYSEALSQFIGHVKLRQYSSFLPRSLSLVKTLLWNKQHFAHS